MSAFDDRVYHLCRWVCWEYFRWYHRLRMYGVEHVPRSGPCILASNHVSVLDPPLVGVAINFRKVHFLAKAELFHPPWGRWLQRLGAVPVERGRGDVGALRRALKLLEEGHLLVLFPEGTRSLDGRLQSAKPGVGLLVLRARVPVVPAFLDGSFAALPKGSFWPRPCRLTVRYGSPILPEELDELPRDRVGYEQAAQRVMNRIAALAQPSDTQQ